ncbi:MAG: hydroxyethylthiazole kinase [Clostridia bacterium]|nr:hydroxyethylthiazole kinase [Clostridia bacterium]
MINKIRHLVSENSPLIHCITNPISINECANTILALDARPIMAEHPREVEQITKTADSLMLNLGNITDVRMNSILISAKTAKQCNIPIVLDAVGISCSTLRRNFINDILNTTVPAVIKGNYSEINSLYNDKYTAFGVDADITLDIKQLSKISLQLAKKYDTIILASGKTDIMTDGKRLVYIKNGCKQLSKVTGTGCMLGAVCAAFVSQQKNIDSVIAACAVLGICGEISQTKKGNASFILNLIDNISILKDSYVDKYIDMEEVDIEKI